MGHDTARRAKWRHRPPATALADAALALAPVRRGVIRVRAGDGGRRVVDLARPEAAVDVRMPSAASPGDARPTLIRPRTSVPPRALLTGAPMKRNRFHHVSPLIATPEEAANLTTSPIKPAQGDSVRPCKPCACLRCRGQAPRVSQPTPNARLIGEPRVNEFRLAGAFERSGAPAGRTMPLDVIAPAVAQKRIARASLSAFPETHPTRVVCSPQSAAFEVKFSRSAVPASPLNAVHHHLHLPPHSFQRRETEHRTPRFSPPAARTMSACLASLAPSPRPSSGRR